MTHIQKKLTRLSKKNQPKNADRSGPSDLKKQYDVIREDLLRLKGDIQKGYSMAKGMVDKRTLFSQLLKVK